MVEEVVQAVAAADAARAQTIDSRRPEAMMRRLKLIGSGRRVRTGGCPASERKTFSSPEEARDAIDPGRRERAG